MQQPSTDRYDICQKADAIHGWLKMVTSRRTVDILHWQEAQGYTGNLMEIGVMCGKYFSLMVDSAMRTGDTVLGIDTFQYANEKRVVTELTGVFGKAVTDRFKLWRRQSNTVSATELTHAIGRPRFISVDGAHDFENVYRDMELAEQVVSHKGVISADDFLNPLTLGVNQAINAFLSRPRAVVPVAFVANKLFLVHRSVEEEYRGAVEEMIRNGKDAEAEAFKQRATHGRHHIEQDFHGHKVLIG
ncbi:class I SAM-dependent methyltransferase [Boseongicola sp. H5]|uniref:class I SAM-dependent methyltransferase n=1 Tax=Rhodobacterales TaxID=204455 RepID=UPI001D0B3CAE|nr:class I SAM-dependent methyltransferase [Boseongicola sp. H5]